MRVGNCETRNIDFVFREDRQNLWDDQVAGNFRGFFVCLLLFFYGLRASLRADCFCVKQKLLVCLYFKPAARFVRWFCSRRSRFWSFLESLEASSNRPDPTRIRFLHWRSPSWVFFLPFCFVPVKTRKIQKRNRCLSNASMAWHGELGKTKIDLGELC